MLGDKFKRKQHLSPGDCLVETCAQIWVKLRVKQNYKMTHCWNLWKVPKFVLGYKLTLRSLALKKKPKTTIFSIFTTVLLGTCHGLHMVLLYENTVICIFFRSAWQKFMLKMGHLSIWIGCLIKLLICFSMTVPMKLFLHARFWVVL